MRKSHSIDTSYLYEEAQSTFTEAVNPKISANQGLGAAIGGDNRHMGGGTNLCKSKSEFNLAFASPTRSGEVTIFSFSFNKKTWIDFQLFYRTIDFVVAVPSKERFWNDC
jgi:hypothetical protein